MQVSGLRAVLQEVAVAQVAVAHVALDSGVVGAVDRHAAVEAAPDAAPLEVLPVHRPHDVPVHRVARDQALLSHEPQGHAREAQGAAGAHDVAAEAGLLAGRAVAPHDHVASEQPDLGALVHRPPGDRLELAVVGERQRLIERHGRPARRGDGDHLRVVGVEVGRGHDQHVAGPPAGRALKQELGRAGGRGGGEPGPALSRLAVEVERPARDAQDPVAHAHDVAVRERSGEGDGRPMPERRRAGAHPQRAQHEDVTRGEIEILLVEHQRALDPEAGQRRRAHVEQHGLARGNHDGRSGRGHLAARPARAFGPAHGGMGSAAPRDRRDPPAMSAHPSSRRRVQE